MLTDHDIYLFREGTHSRLYRHLGCHFGSQDDASGAHPGAHFGVWAPNARHVAVIGEWSDWRPDVHPLVPRADSSGIWEGFVAGIRPGQAYKYRIESQRQGYVGEKADPLAFYAEQPPATASRAWNLDYKWEDADWMQRRARANALDAPMSTYELHLGSWRRKPNGDWLGYREAAHALADYVQRVGFTHVELLPITEHPFYGSWGYQTTGYFAPTARYGNPQDFMYLVDTLHQAGIAVILDWVPSHFPNDAHGLHYFDGTFLYEHADPRQGFHPEWKSYIFNYGRNEVRAFLLSSAMFWLDRYHIDGLRVDAVASMLYLDYGRKAGEWIPNRYGGRENLDAIEFLRKLNETAYRDHPGVQVIAEESTAWPQVSRPVYTGGLGFGLKWNMGWMHDTLDYMAIDPLYRSYHHHRLTFSLVYAFHENFVLPLSHDEVVYGKRALLEKMPGDEWQKFANLRLLFGYMWTHPGKKLLFMGAEIGERREWSHDGSIDWHLLDYAPHAELQTWMSDLNALYRAQPALHQRDFDGSGFAWIDCNDAHTSVISYMRYGGENTKPMLVVCNLTPVPQHNYIVGVPFAGYWRELLNSDAPRYGGSGMGNLGGMETSPVPAHGHLRSLTLTLPPLAALIFGAPDV
ncbi:MAG: 1,4-alpha-glucan branching protein GlgB [Betaproteobacteria bacterium]|nr:1,4-alpha-glucan branching protein GlgB [Betaproteobacteria bacterium]